MVATSKIPVPETKQPDKISFNAAPSPQPGNGRPEHRLPYLDDLKKEKLFLPLSLGVYGMASLDMRETVATGGLGWRSELDPLAKPLTCLPAPAYYITGIALATTVNWLALKMERTKRWHRVWWVPQISAISANAWGYASTKARE